MSLVRVTRTRGWANEWARSPVARKLAFHLLGVGLLLPLAPAFGQRAAGHVCGDGSTFDVILPGIDPPGIDPQLPDNTITLPGGCRMYALLVSGYQENRDFDRLTFFNLGKWILQNDGYVHWAWWNNLLEPYLEGSLHRNILPPDPGSLTNPLRLWGFAPESLLARKAVPNDDYQFQSDASRFVSAIRQHNPNALIVVAGHSMGGNAVARLGASTRTRIDLLAPIDPVGNRSEPLGPQYPFGSPPAACLIGATQSSQRCRIYNWTRWRATHEFLGYKQWDCVRTGPGGRTGVCRDFDPSILRTEYRCRARPGPWLAERPDLPTRAPIACPRVTPIIHQGTQVAFSSNIRRLYHRWQNEAFFPFDFETNYRFGSAGRQETVQTCASGTDPDEPTIECNDTDGHGEIVGYRGPPLPEPFALEVQMAQMWGDDRRSAIIELANLDEGEQWSFRPRFPDLDMVSADMVAIVQELLEEEEEGICENDELAPETIAVPSPSPNTAGWHNQDDLVINLLAQDEVGGSGVASVSYELEGAEQITEPMIVADDRAEIPLSAEGITTVRYWADDCRNTEAPNELIARIDRTPPDISAEVMPTQNANGWNNTDVLVTFSAEDFPPPGAPLDWASGVNSASDPVSLVTEGASQHVTGEATDVADNLATLIVEVNIDKTPPELSGLPEDCTLWPPNGKMVWVANVIPADGLSGVELGSFAVSATSNEPDVSRGKDESPDILINGGMIALRAERSGAGNGRVYEITASVSDLAGNGTTETATCTVQHDKRRGGAEVSR